MAHQLQKLLDLFVSVTANLRNTIQIWFGTQLYTSVPVFHLRLFCKIDNVNYFKIEVLTSVLLKIQFWDIIGSKRINIQGQAVRDWTLDCLTL